MEVPIIVYDLNISPIILKHAINEHNFHYEETFQDS